MVSFPYECIFYVVVTSVFYMAEGELNDKQQDKHKQESFTLPNALFDTASCSQCTAIIHVMWNSSVCHVCFDFARCLSNHCSCRYLHDRLNQLQEEVNLLKSNIMKYKVQIECCS